MSKRKWVIALVLFLLYEAAVWVGGRWLSSDSDLRLVSGLLMTGLGLTILVVYFLVSRISLQHSASQARTPESEPVAMPSPAPFATGEENVEALRTLLADANRRLRESPTLASRRIRTNALSLPLYLLAGPEGSGKTSTFVNSGLEPELLAGQVFRDTAVVPTPLCNLWFAGEALFAELSGRLFSGDPSHWSRLLGFFRGKRRDAWLRGLGTGSGQNFRGVVLFCDITNFTNFMRSPDSDPRRLVALARSFQERLRPVGETFGKNFPVYVVFTKCDDMTYFGDFFGHLDETEDQQILGCTVPTLTGAERKEGEVYAEAETKRLSQSFDKLYYSLVGKRLDFLGRESSQSKKRQFIYEYPRELKRVRDGLIQFLVDLFRPNPLQPGPQLRGFYFTGTLKVAPRASTVDQGQEQSSASSDPGATRWLRTEDLHKRVGYTTHPETGFVHENLAARWCFVAELFSGVVLADRTGMGGGFLNRRKVVYEQVAFGCVVVLFLVLSVLFFRSWYGNFDLLRDVERVIASSPQSKSQLGDLPSLESLQALEPLRKKTALLSDYDREGPPWNIRWWLYSGSYVLPKLSDLYFQRFHDLFLDRIYSSLTSMLQSLRPAPASSATYGAVYDSLKAYLMITSENCKPEKTFLSPLLLEVWESGRQLDAPYQSLARQQIDFYSQQLEHKNPYSLEERAEPRDRARSYLANIGGVQRIYQGLIVEANAPTRKPAKLADLASNYEEVLTGPAEVRASFTHDGCAFVRQEIQDGKRITLGETCVIGSKGVVGGLQQGVLLQRELENLYIKDYIQAWAGFIGGFNVASYQSPADAARKLEILASHRSPLLALLKMVAQNTDFSDPVPSASQKAIAKESKKLMDRLLSPRARQAGQVVQSLSGETEGERRSVSDITKVFQPVHVVVAPANSERWIDEATNGNYVKGLQGLQLAMQSLAQSGSTDPTFAQHEAIRSSAQVARQAVLALKSKFSLSSVEGVDTAVSKLLEQPIDGVQAFVRQTEPATVLNKGFSALCQKLGGLLRKYPFNPQTQSEVAAEELSAMFAPDSGALWQFHQQYLAQLLVKQGRQYRQSSDGQGIRLKPDFLSFFGRLALISETLFADGGSQPRMRYSLRPLPNKSIQELNMDLDGETLIYRGQPVEPKHFSWPGARRVSLSVKAGATITFASHRGLWGIFIMMGDADQRPPGSKIVELSKVKSARGLPEPVLDQDGRPIIVKLEIADLPGGIDVFDRNFFTGLRCPSSAAQ